MDTIFNKYSDNEQMRKESIISDNLSNIDNASKSYSNLQTQVDDVSKTIDSIKKASSNIGDDLKSSLQDLSASIKSIKSELESVKSNKISNIFDESSLINESQQIESFVKQLNDNISSTVKIKDIISTQVSESVDSQQIQQIFLELGNKINNIVSSGNGMNDVLNVIKQLKQSATEANSSLSSMNTAMSDQSINTSMSNNTNAMKEFNETSRKASDFASSFNKQQTQYSDELSKTTSNISKIAKEVVEASSGFDKVDSIAKKLFMSISSTNNMSVIDELTKAAEVGKAALNRNNDSQDIDDSNNKANALASSMTNIISLINEFSKNQIGNSSEISSDKYREIIGTTTNISENSGNALNKYTSMLEYESERTGNESHLNAANSLKMLTKEFVDATNNTLSNLNASLVSSINEETKILGNNFNNINQQGTNTYNDVNLGISSIHYKNIPNNLNSSSKEIESAMSAFGMQTEKINNGENPLLYSKISGNYLTNRSGFGQDLIDIQRKNTLGQMSIPGIMNKLKDAKSSGDQKLVVGLLEKLVVITESTAKAHLSAGGKIDLSKGQFNGLNENDKKTIDGFLSSAGSSSNSLSETIKAIEAVDPSNKSIDNLKKMRKELVDMKGEIETVKDKSGSIFSGAKGLISSIGKVTGVMGAGLGIMGLGALAPTISNGKKFVSNSFQSYEDDGKRRYQSAKNDFYTGNNLDVGKANELTNSMAEKYFKMSNGMIDFGEPTKYNTNLVRNVGGHYGESNASASKDMMSITRDTFALSKVYDLSDSTISSTMKTFYKDLRMSASDASYTLTSLCQTAISSNIPVEKYVNTVTSLANSLRDVGVDGRTTVSIMGNLVKSGMRTEDASQMLSDTANAGVKMGDNWSRSAFYGMMSGQSGDIWNNIESGMLSHNSNGDVNKSYYGTMAQRLASESGMMMGIGGGNNPLGISLLMQSLKQQGYSQKSASTIASAAKNGNFDKMQDLLQKADEEKDGGKEELTKAMNNADANLKSMSGQLAETTKIQADITLKEKEMGDSIRNNLTPGLEKFRSGFDNALNTVTGKLGEFVEGLGSLLNSPLGKSMTNTFAEHPIASTLVGLGGAAGAYALGSAGMKAAGSKIGSVAEVGSSKIAQAIGRMPKAGKIGLIGAAAFGAYEGYQHLFNSTSDSGEKVNKTLQDGTTKIQVINSNSNNVDNSKQNNYNDDKEYSPDEQQFNDNVNNNEKNETHKNDSTNYDNGVVSGLAAQRYKTDSLSNFGAVSKSLGVKNVGLQDVINVSKKFAKSNAYLSVAGAAGDEALDYASGTNRTPFERLERMAIGGGATMLGSLAGGAVGSLVAPGAGTMIGSMAGGALGTYLGHKLKKMAGTADEDDNKAKDEYSKASNDQVDKYTDDTDSLINSNDDRTKAVEKHLKEHGQTLSDLNKNQQKYLDDLFLQLKAMGMGDSAAANLAAEKVSQQATDVTQMGIDASNLWDNSTGTKEQFFRKKADEQKASEGDSYSAQQLDHTAQYFSHAKDGSQEGDNSSFYSDEAKKMSAMNQDERQEYLKGFNNTSVTDRVGLWGTDYSSKDVEKLYEKSASSDNKQFKPEYVAGQEQSMLELQKKEQQNPSAVKAAAETFATQNGINKKTGAIGGSSVFSENYDVTSPYGQRISPTTGATTDHKGVDYATPENTTLHAMGAGTAKYYPNNGDSGNMLEIEYDNKMKSRYMHLNGLVGDVDGQRVTAGQSVALSGNTGNSTGPHSHISVLDANGEYVDPTDYVKKGISPTTANGLGDGSSALKPDSPQNTSQSNVMNAFNSTVNSYKSMVSQLGGKDILKDKVATGQLVLDGMSAYNSDNRKFNSIASLRNSFIMNSGEKDSDRYGSGYGGVFTGDGKTHSNSGSIALRANIDEKTKYDKTPHYNSYESDKLNSIDQAEKDRLENRKKSESIYENDKTSSEEKQKLIDEANEAKNKTNVEINIQGTSTNENVATKKDIEILNNKINNNKVNVDSQLRAHAEVVKSYVSY